MRQPADTRGHPRVRRATEPSRPVLWRRALIGLVSAAVRVHHYRDLHSRMLRDALDERDCGAHVAGGADCERQ